MTAAIQFGALKNFRFLPASQAEYPYKGYAYADCSLAALADENLEIAFNMRTPKFPLSVFANRSEGGQYECNFTNIYGQTTNLRFDENGSGVENEIVINGELYQPLSGRTQTDYYLPQSEGAEAKNQRKIANPNARKVLEAMIQDALTLRKLFIENIKA